MKNNPFIEPNKIILGDCTDTLKTFSPSMVDLVYFDPPFFTQKKHTLTTRDNTKQYEFDDKYDSLQDYLNMIEITLIESRRVLKDTGSVFLHCDRTASHHIRLLLDKIFGVDNFQSEIVWSYKRWSNAKKGLLNAHQIIFFYSKTHTFKFNTIYTQYSATTNIDQIMQARCRDENGKAVYKKDRDGNVVIGEAKKGVPLTDTWDIPYLNPKAKERVGYPTQKPVLLLKRVISIATDEGDLVLDPFCGSGTTCVAAKLLNRQFIGIDISADAVALANQRLAEMVITESRLLIKGEDDYLEKNDAQLRILDSLNAHPVQRNSGIDGFLREYYENKPVPIKIQNKNETINEAIQKLERACAGHTYHLKIVVQTCASDLNQLFEVQSDVKVIKILQLQLAELTKQDHTLVLT